MLYTEDEKRKQWDIARDKVKNIIENNDIKGRIKIDRDVLEKLLFDVYTFKVKGEKELSTFVIPAWSGPFLQKIDLSEVDFRRVYFNDISKLEEKVSKLEDIFQIRRAKEKKSDSEYNVDYSNTNVNIDMSHREFYKCNFENITLHGARGAFTSCNLKNVKFDDEKFSGPITLSDIDKSIAGDVPIICRHNCNMENSNLSRTAKGFASVVMSIVGRGNNYKNTGLHIIYNMYDMNERGERIFATSREFKENLIEILDNGYVEGCYFDVVHIKYGEERDDVDYWKNHNFSVIRSDGHIVTSLSLDSPREVAISSNLITSKEQFWELFSHTALGKDILSLDIQKELVEMINDKVEMIKKSVDEQIKSKQ